MKLNCTIKIKQEKNNWTFKSKKIDCLFNLNKKCHVYKARRIG